MKSSRNLKRRDILILAVAVSLVAAIYLLASQLTYKIGFPLDDFSCRIAFFESADFFAFLEMFKRDVVLNSLEIVYVEHGRLLFYGVNRRAI